MMSFLLPHFEVFAALLCSSMVIMDFWALPLSNFLLLVFSWFYDLNLEGLILFSFCGLHI